MMPSVSLFLLSAAIAAFAAYPPAQDQHSTAPPTESTQSQPAQQPPAPQDHTEANRRIHDSISDALSSDPLLSGADVDATVDDHNITLTGSVTSYPQHQRVLQLVSAFGRWRNIVDKIALK
jgi:BON domain-containing protein